MTKIFKQLARHWAVCLVVFALLFVQAYCDLSLPDYTRAASKAPCLPQCGRARWMPSRC